MTDQDQRWSQVGRAISARINELKMTKAEVLRRSGLTAKTLDRYIDGAPLVRPDKTRSLCEALGWTIDSIDLILAGGEPRLASTGPNDDPPASDALTDPDVMGIAALAGEMTPTQRARVEAYMRGLLDSEGS